MDEQRPPSQEIEPKADGSRPLSWGDRVEQRKSRERAGKSAKAPSLIARFFAWFMSSLARLARSAGMSRRRVVVDGVVYREKNNTSLRRSLSPTGIGYKEYQVRFPVHGGSMPSAQYPLRESMEIRYTPARVFADLGHDPRLGFLDQIRSHIKPGDRVLELGCGTGPASAQLADLVGPSGGVVAMTRDGPSIRFARQRYRQDHLAFELGWLETLAGELDAGFDAIVAVDLFRDAPDDPSKSRAIAELWRLVSEGGPIVLISTQLASPGKNPAKNPEEHLDPLRDRLESIGAESVKALDPDETIGWRGIIGFRPESKPA